MYEIPRQYKNLISIITLATIIVWAFPTTLPSIYKAIMDEKVRMILAITAGLTIYWIINRDIGGFIEW